MPGGGNDKDRARINALVADTRTLEQLISEAQRLRSEIEQHLQSLRRQTVDRSLPPERRNSVRERRANSRRDRRKS
jgi:hypothetical protein